MRLAFISDPLERLDATLDSTVGLIKAAWAMGHEVWVTEANRLAVVDRRAHAWLRRLRVPEGGGSDWFAYEGDARWLTLEGMDAVFFRTDPPVDQAYLHATYILDLVDPALTMVVNDPRGIRYANEKLYALQFPELVPPTLVSGDASHIASFVSDHGRAVIKPIDGHAGRGVLQLRCGDPNFASIVELATERGAAPAVVQAYLDVVAEGNKRLFVVGGEIVGAVMRFPASTDFRIGPPSELAAVTAADVAMVARLAPSLGRHGLWLVGVDVIGDRLIEINVTSPGAMAKTDVALGTRLSEGVIARLEAARSGNGSATPFSRGAASRVVCPAEPVILPEWGTWH